MMLSTQPRNALTREEYNRQCRAICVELFATAVGEYGWNLHRTARHCGLSSGTVYKLWDRLADPAVVLRWHVSTLFKLAHGLGYDLVIVTEKPKRRAKRKLTKAATKQMAMRRPKPQAVV